MDHAVRGRVDVQRLAKLEGMQNPRTQKRFVGRRIANRQHPDRNLRSIAEKGVADSATSWADDLDDVAARGRDVNDVRAVDPRMAGANALFSTWGDHD